MSNATAITIAPVYFEESWAILSSICLISVLYGIMIIGITSPSPLVFVPLVVSGAGAVANGLCYYAFYGNYNKIGSITAAGFADIFWLIQEAGLSFYSYLILARVLKHRSRQIFMGLFWSLIILISSLRIAILISRVKNIFSDNDKLQKLITHLHIGYFTSIAVIEILSAVFLLRKFAAARKGSMEVASKTGLFSYLMRSTEVRLATLALIGITRAITYSFQETAQSAANTPGQIDRFVYSLECMFPIMMFIDILASKLVVTNHIHSSSSRTHSAYAKNSSSRHNQNNNHLSIIRNRDRDTNIGLYSMNHTETRVDANGQLSSSQEYIVAKGEGMRAMEIVVDDESVREGRACGGAGLNGGISKTVEFELKESSV